MKILNKEITFKNLDKKNLLASIFYTLIQGGVLYGFTTLVNHIAQQELINNYIAPVGAIALGLVYYFDVDRRRTPSVKKEKS